MRKPEVRQLLRAEVNAAEREQNKLKGQKDTVLQVDLLRQVHFTGDCGENETLLPAVGQRELDLPVQTTRAEQSRVQSVGSVGGHDHLKTGKRGWHVLKAHDCKRDMWCVHLIKAQMIIL